MKLTVELVELFFFRGERLKKLGSQDNNCGTFPQVAAFGNDLLSRKD